MEENTQLIGTRTIEHGEDAVQCFICKAIIKARYFVHHQKRCLADHPSHIAPSLKTARDLMASLASNNPLINNLYAVYKNAYSHKDLQLVIRNDRLLLQYLTLMINSKDASRYQDVRSGINYLASLLKIFRRRNPEATSKDLVMPQNYEQVLSAVK